MISINAQDSLPLVEQGVPRNADGPDTQAMEALILEHRPKLFVTTAVLHNPTGTSTSQAVAYRLLQLAEKYDLMLIEDDIYGDFHGGRATRLAALDQLNRVIYVSSFSKTISASLRVGFMACHKDLAQDMMLAPGNIFSPQPVISPWLRFNAAYCDGAPQLFESLGRLLDDSAVGS
ncbi:MAG: aminotransferase class I/II-fold pyridoxal phosphate-dependent enzyme [Motiliproteus sp.]